ncbi:hypothetical protein ANCDUO_01446 [Ancylostoma duodenale]|uniref:Uncharacterized protein n=1 Tax=Ancylostoma duodenale TaxID=51022 RepID=A0A0C2H330_9BILA|nr:hypothetical protein ANCDUO_01446 [Ancylostoma duodenale]
MGSDIILELHELELVRWRNEKNTCDVNGDEIDFIRMKGSWGESEGDTIFGKSDRAGKQAAIDGKAVKKCAS